MTTPDPREALQEALLDEAAFDITVRGDLVQLERLARALRDLDVLEEYPWADQKPEGWRHRILAENIAREYAALAATSREGEG